MQTLNKIVISDLMDLRGTYFYYIIVLGIVKGKFSEGFGYYINSVAINAINIDFT